MGYSVREATHADHESLLALWVKLTFDQVQAHSQPFGQVLKQERLDMLDKVLTNAFGHSQTCIFVVESETKTDSDPDQQAGGVIATLSVVLNQQAGFKEPNSAVLFNLWVEESFRRKGIASMLVSAAQAWLTENQATSVQVGWHPNSAAEQFWTTQGYLHYETIAAKRLP